MNSKGSREMASEARERIIYEWMERMKMEIENLTVVPLAKMQPKVSGMVVREFNSAMIKMFEWKSAKSEQGQDKSRRNDRCPRRGIEAALRRCCMRVIER